MLFILRQLCASQETLPRSCILQFEFETTDPHQAAGGFADVWKGTYGEKAVAFKTLRSCTQADDAARTRRRVRNHIFFRTEQISDAPSFIQRRFCKEVVLWKSLNHPNILGLVGVCRWDNSPDAKLTMVSEWMTNGNIAEYIKHNESYRTQLVRKNSLSGRTGTYEIL